MGNRMSSTGHQIHGKEQAGKKDGRQLWCRLTWQVVNDECLSGYDSRPHLIK